MTDAPGQAATPADNRTANLALAWGGLLAMASAVGIGRFIYTPILPPMVQALDLSKAAAGLIASANYAGYFCGALLAAQLRLGGSRRAWLLGALAVGATTTLLMGAVDTMPWFLALRFTGGVASAVVLIHASALVLERLSLSGQSRLVALHFSGVGAGIIVSAIAVAALIQSGRDWNWLWYAGGTLALVAAALVALLVPDGSTTQAPHGHNTAAPLTGTLRRMAVAYGLFGFGYVITATFIVSIIRATPAIQALEPIIWVIVGLAAAPSVVLWGTVARRLGTATGYALAALTQAIAVLASVLWQTTPGIVLSAILLGGTFMGLTALGLMRARELAQGPPHRAMALLTGCFGFGQIVGPIFAGALYDHMGNLTAASVVAALGLVLAAGLAFVRPLRPASR